MSPCILVTDDGHHVPSARQVSRVKNPSSSNLTIETLPLRTDLSWIRPSGGWAATAVSTDLCRMRSRDEPASGSFLLELRLRIDNLQPPADVNVAFCRNGELQW